MASAGSNLLADAAADPVLALLLRNVPGRLYDLMVTVGPAADDVIAGSRRRLLALIRARGANGAGQEMEQHVEGLSWMAKRYASRSWRQLFGQRTRFQWWTSTTSSSAAEPSAVR